MKGNLYDDLKKLHGLPPYDGDGNIVKGDSYFAACIRRNYSAADIERVKRELGIIKQDK
jgi:hypothetical protein